MPGHSHMHKERIILIQVLHAAFLVPDFKFPAHTGLRKLLERSTAWHLGSCDGTIGKHDDNAVSAANSGNDRK